MLTTAAACGARTAVKYSQRPGPTKKEKCWAKRVLQAAQLIAYAMRKNIASRVLLGWVPFNANNVATVPIRQQGSRQRLHFHRQHSRQIAHNRLPAIARVGGRVDLSAGCSKVNTARLERID